MEPVRKQQKEATRLALRDAALRCFQRKGFAGTSIADITDEAGVAKGTFYVHFATKEALLDEVLAETNARLAFGVAEALRGSLDHALEPLVRAVAERVVSFFVEEQDFVRAYAERATLGLEASALSFGISPETRAVLLAALRARFPSLRAKSAELVVLGLLAMWIRLLLQRVSREDLTDAEVVDVLVALSTGALAPFTETPPPRRTR